MAEQQGSSPMFAIFVLTLLSLALFPYTIYRFCNNGDEEEAVVKPWQVLAARCVLHLLLTMQRYLVRYCCCMFCVDQNLPFANVLPLHLATSYCFLPCLVASV